MQAAMNCVIQDDPPGISINQAAREHGIPPTTLKDRISGRVLHGTKPGPRPYLSDTEEAELESYLFEVARLEDALSNHDNMDAHYALLKDYLDKNDLLSKPQQIYNMTRQGCH